MMRETSECIATAELLFEYEDFSIHDDLYDIIEYMAEQGITVTAARGAKVLWMWEEFLGPMLGISPVGGRAKEEVEEEEDTTVKLGVENEEFLQYWFSDGDDEAEESIPVTVDASEAGLVSASEQSRDEQPEHEAEDEEGQDAKLAESEGSSSPDCKPLAASGSEAFANHGSIPKKAERVFYGNEMFYVLFRLHRSLYVRILIAKENAELEAKKKKKKCSGSGLLFRFKSILLNLLNGTIDNSDFEDYCMDYCRPLIGDDSDVLFTLDKLCFKLVKQLDTAVNDHMALKLLALHAYVNASKAVESVYHANACMLLQGKRIYRFEYKSDELLIQITNEGPMKQEVGGSSFQSYLDDFLLKVSPSKNQRVFMMRSKKRNYAGRNEDEAL